MKIIFVCHATSQDNERGLASGHFDVPLSETGLRQAAELKTHFANDSFDAVFTSDLRRAFNTAQIAFGERGVPILRDSRLRECDYGDFTQHPVSEVDAERVRRIAEPFPRGESYQMAADRMRNFLRDALRSYTTKKIIVVGHRATQYGLEHWINRVSLEDVMLSPWTWQPGWSYELEKLDTWPATP